MKYDNEYYLLEEKDESTKHILWQTKRSDSGLSELISPWSIKDEVIALGEVEIQYGDKYKFTPSDYHFTGDMLVSKKFKEVIETFKPFGIDFYKTNIRNIDDIWPEYYFMHIWNNHRVMHQGRSVIDGTYIDDDFILESFSLDEKKLDNIPIKERLIFCLTENPQYIFHQTVVNALKLADLSGVRFIAVKDWNTCCIFNE